MRLIAGGVVEREGVNGLAARLGYSERHLHRCLLQALGAGPLALARAQRAQTARVLLETSDLGIGELALTAGFASVRQFNTTMRQVFDRTPRELRAGRTAGASGGAAGAPAGGVTVRLAYRTPFDGAGLLAFLAARAVPGVEQALPGGYRRSLSLPRGEGVVELTPGGSTCGRPSGWRTCATWEQRSAAAAACWISTPTHTASSSASAAIQ
jgi:AraC family transcriptional regulator of adaptative response / DNA-3-methyladenine glycosylase II